PKNEVRKIRDGGGGGGGGRFVLFALMFFSWCITNTISSLARDARKLAPLLLVLFAKNSLRNCFVNASFPIFSCQRNRFVFCFKFPLTAHANKNASQSSRPKINKIAV